jgi:hypothetical protein
MTKETGGSAFPWFTPEGHYNGSVHEQGMTLRDWFAGMALQHITGVIDAELTKGGVDTRPLPEILSGLAGLSYQIADAMLKARGE